ncbi:hypothetical protein BKA67DRAFT_661708 [Truncatella angustata]|uniref:Uncharacterized protein n=1 Tax=Truncatella angustata TaxID=152316 RepID=A0A9P8ZV98_9PEZI|nr:uncharacterized protein BKA67DRAFT_661708 [Truncatella angustata]KAH6648758.1 hypothetical protein BKA67DRAFT_661708 [Truncatella angustata]
MSTTSTISSSSSTVSHPEPHSFNPLSCHPPLSFNTAPVLEENEDELHQEQQQSGSDYDDPDSALDYYFNQDSRRRTYIYDQQSQWPLKDWQTVLPNPADPKEQDLKRHTLPRTNTSSSNSSQRRPQRDFETPLESFVKRGEWKRRGIVFGLDSDAEDEQTRHFEVNPFELVG